MRTSGAKRGVRKVINDNSRARSPDAISVSPPKTTDINCSKYRNNIVFTALALIANISELRVYTLLVLLVT